MRSNRRITPWLFLAPGLAVFGAAVLLPMTLTVGYSFTEWNGFGPMTFVGLDNYARAIDDALFRSSFVHVLIYIAATLVLEVAVGLGLAGLVTSQRRGVWFRVAIFTPVMLPMVVIAVLWAFIYNPDFGLINGALEAAGLGDHQRIWLGDPETALLAISVVSGWVYAGFYMVIFYAAFRQIPAEVLEAGRLDGAGEWALFRHVKVPMIRNATAIAILLCVTGGFQGFDLFFVLTNGGPHGATEIPTTLLVKTVFRNSDVGYGSAMAVILTAVVVSVGLVYVRLQGRAAARAGGALTGQR
jgi:raffinose/stachyose/melibiose transport system permease protein